MEITGLHHHLAAMTYVLRNALHHGLVPIPYAYPHCSVNAIFRKEMGKKSVYHLSRMEKQQIGEALHRQYRIGEAQIRRCLAIF